MNRTILTLTLLLVFTLNGFAQYNKAVRIEPILKTDTTSIGQKIVFPDTGNEEVTMLKVIIPPGASTGWHKHDYPVFAYVLKGTLSVDPEKGKTKTFSENACFAEVINTYHNGSNKGKEEVVLIAIYLGIKGKALSVKKEKDK